MIDEITRCYILRSLYHVVQQHQSFSTTYDFLYNMQEMFIDKGRSTRQATLRFIMNIRMFKRTLVGEHMIKMISLFNEMKIFVAEIDGETKIEMILETLLTSFCQFKLMKEL